MPQGHTGLLRYENTWVDGQDVPATPAWTNIAKAIDVSINMDSADGQADSREADFVPDVGGIRNAEITMGFRQTATDHATYTKLIGSKETPFLLQVLNGTTAANHGWQMPVIVTGHRENQPNQGAMNAEFTLKYFPAVDASGDLIQPSRVTHG